MITVSIKIKADVDNLTMENVFDLLKIYRLAEDRDQLFEFNGYIFRIESVVGISIDYTITEIRQK